MSNIRKRESPSKKKKDSKAGLRRHPVNSPQVNSSPATNVQMKPAIDNSLHYPLSPTSGRLDILTEAMRLVIQGETNKLYSTESGAIQTYFY